MASAFAETGAALDQVTSLGGRTRSHSHPHPHPHGSGAGSNNHHSDDSDRRNGSLHAHRQDHNSSKLPTFRLADILVKDSQLLSPRRQQQQQQQQQQHPLSPASSATRVLSPSQYDQDSSQGITLHDKVNSQIPATPVSPDPHQLFRSPHDEPDSTEEGSPRRHHGSTNQDSADSSPTTVHPALGAKRPAVYSDTRGNRKAVHVWAKASTSSSTKEVDDSPVSSVDGFSPITLHPLPVRRKTDELEYSGLAPASCRHSCGSTKDWAQGQRELLLPKTLAETTGRNKPDDIRRSRPPVSFRPPNLAASFSGGRVPPIRSFRSSGSRKSLVLDMEPRRVSVGSSGEDVDPNMRDRTLRALEGRSDDDYSQMTPPDSADATPDHDNTAEIFMRIANDDVIRHALDGSSMATAEGQAMPRAARLSRRRPLSVAVTTHQTTTAPQLPRRLSDQRENSQSRLAADEQLTQRMSGELSYRAASRDPRDRPLPSTEGDDYSRPQSSRTSALRPHPITPRQTTFHDASPEVGGAFTRRRTSMTDSGYGGLQSRTAQLRTGSAAYGQGRTYNSSPLAPKPDSHVQQREGSHGLEGTESSISTAAPSTVWDELEELKSRINRLESTGKLPPPSVVAMSGASDDRPATATTNATTMSASPKRGSGQSAAQGDLASTTSSLRDQQPILFSALSKVKVLTSAEVFHAIESAAKDALALSSMIGAPGQPGPISSGASTIGGSGVTDRQLRRKADSICRSLTELCLALSDESPRRKMASAAIDACEPEDDNLSPTTTSKVSQFPSSRRTALPPEQGISRVHTAPARGPTSLEQRRYTMLNSPTLVSPRLNLPPSNPVDTPSASRKSALLAARRRAGTEEPEEASGRKSSLLLRTRRERTEEIEDSRSEVRKPPSLLRNRRDIRSDDEEEAHLLGARGAGRERDLAQSQLPASEMMGTATASSVLPRRSRLYPPSATSRLAAPTITTTAAATTSASTTGTRRYLNRPTPDRDVPVAARDRSAEDRPTQQRQFSSGSTLVLARSGSTNRRSSLIPSGLPTPR